MIGYLFLWAPTDRYYVACRSCFESDKNRLTAGSKGVWKITKNVFYPFRQMCFRTIAGSCEAVLSAGNGAISDYLFNPMGQPAETSNYILDREILLPQPTEEQLQNSVRPE